MSAYPMTEKLGTLRAMRVRKASKREAPALYSASGPGFEDRSPTRAAKPSSCAAAHEDGIAPVSSWAYSITAVTRALHLFLLLGALVGLFGQAVACASVPSAVSAPMAMSGMTASGISADSMKIDAKHKNGRPT